MRLSELEAQYIVVKAKGKRPAATSTFPPIAPNPSASAEGIAARFERNFPGVLKAMSEIE